MELKSTFTCLLTIHCESVNRSVVSNSETPWTIACQAPLSMEFSRWDYWGELPFPSPEDLPNPGIKPGSPTLQADSLLSEAAGKLLWLAYVYFFPSYLLYNINIYYWFTTVDCICYAMLCYAKLLQSCPTLCDPIDGSHQAPPSMELSRQEYWSGVPLPSPWLYISDT